MNTANNTQAMLACLNSHTLPELASEMQESPTLLFGQFEPGQLLTTIYQTIEEDFSLGVAGRDEFTLLEKALFLSTNSIDQSDAMVKMAAILHNNELLFSADGKLNADMAPGYFGTLARDCHEITEKVKAELPDTDAAKRILEEESNAADLFVTACSALQFMSVLFYCYPLLTMDVETRIITAGAWVAEMADDFGSHEDFAEIFFDYYDRCYEMLEQFIALPSEISKHSALDFLQKIDEDSSAVSTDEIIDFLGDTNILSLHEALESADCPELEEETLDYLASVAAIGSKQLLTSGSSMDTVMDLAEKALLLACDETLVSTILIQIALLLGTVEDLDFDEDEIALGLIPGHLAKSALPYACLYDSIEEDNGSQWSGIWLSAGACGGISNVIDKAYAFQMLFEALTDKYTDCSDAIDEDVVETAIEGWDIETEDDPEDFVASIYEYYDDFSYKLQMLETPLRKLKDYRNFLN